MRLTVSSSLPLLALIAAPSAVVPAAEPPALATELVCSGAASPTWIGTPPADASRLWVLEQRTGAIRIFDRTANAWKPEPVLIVSPLRSSDNEQGLLGMAFHPAFATNGFIYVYHTAPEKGKAGQVRVDRWTVTKEIADPASRQPVISIEQPEGNHNGGWIEFAPDGCLWLGVGDGGGANDMHGRAGNGQDLKSLHGKLLRLDVRKTPYAVPADNPFARNAKAAPEIAALGLRNPWRCAFDRATGDLWIGDVGQNVREEVDLLPAGKLGLNYGWRPREGFIPTPKWPDEKPVGPTVDPIIDYDHATGMVSITGGPVYRGKAIPALNGWYFYGDFAAQRVFRLDADAARIGTKVAPVEITKELNPTRKNGNISTFGTDADGEIYIAGYSTGQIYRVIAAK